MVPIKTRVFTRTLRSRRRSSSDGHVPILLCLFPNSPTLRSLNSNNTLNQGELSLIGIKAEMKSSNHDSSGRFGGQCRQSKARACVEKLCTDVQVQTAGYQIKQHGRGDAVEPPGVQNLGKVVCTRVMVPKRSTFAMQRGEAPPHVGHRLPLGHAAALKAMTDAIVASSFCRAAFQEPRLPKARLLRVQGPHRIVRAPGPGPRSSSNAPEATVVKTTTLAV